MAETMINAEIEIKVPFYDVDSMSITWHGNYAKYLEDARCALLDKIGYNYDVMLNSGYAWPLVGLKIKYISPARFNQKIRVRAMLEEYENCIKIKYIITDAETKKTIAKAETVQMAIDMNTMQSLYFSPQILLDKVRGYLEKS
ncbi:MAG: acyl-CoA thioesterase [Holophagaceae bacterium]|nr:acyl-CoA thioesterase [Holophagaceae bacterium]